MRPTMFTRSLIGVLILVCLVGAVDASGDDQWDLTVIFGVVIAGLGLLLFRTVAGRPLVPIRADLVRWLATRAAIHGESPGYVADRAVAAYRDGLVGSQDTRGLPDPPGPSGSRVGGT